MMTDHFAAASSNHLGLRGMVLRGETSARREVVNNLITARPSVAQKADGNNRIGVRTKAPEQNV